ncbi:unnamed protein product [Vitrella brassicaformis CCMP3155]|uniref:Uncharacterized protein n=1 Tax=Vitrella brassicaformis (strain CCMP3155) TaxID=1169540 RepID=A0A0G4FSQ2_VITBC|nr:unnamed protein product [Vitrella brassicaformis CCMP3155]|mmetsp:Transcript_7437/g.21374  ORF Transcript_7437/g.21374 Transcript_7437/m.21374 type:complete len:376 (-) Transcript_7437:264-1391(-)|eukprot:CEM17690.1 unnamed protein product [Vitrella brassicaformis CCMP3155]
MPPADKTSVPSADGVCFFSLIDEVIFSLILLCSDLASCVALRRTNKADGHRRVTPALILDRIDASLAAEGMTGLLDVSRQPTSIPLPVGLSYFDYLVRSAHLLDVTKGWKRWTKGIYIARNKRMISGSNSLPVPICPASLHLTFPYKRAMSNMPHAIAQFAAFGGQLDTDQDGTLGLTRLRRRQYRIGTEDIAVVPREGLEGHPYQAAFEAKDPAIRILARHVVFSFIYPSFSGYINQRILTHSISILDFPAVPREHLTRGQLARGHVSEADGMKLLDEPITDKTVLEYMWPEDFKVRYIGLAGDKAEDTYAALVSVGEGPTAIGVDVRSFEQPISGAQGGHGRYPRCWAATEGFMQSMGMDYDRLGIQQTFHDE